MHSTDNCPVLMWWVTLIMQIQPILGSYQPIFLQFRHSAPLFLQILGPALSTVHVICMAQLLFTDVCMSNGIISCVEKWNLSVLAYLVMITNMARNDNKPSSRLWHLGCPIGQSLFGLSNHYGRLTIIISYNVNFKWIYLLNITIWNIYTLCNIDWTNMLHTRPPS